MLTIESIESKVIEEQLKGPGSWKLNVSLLTNKDYVDTMGCVIPVWINQSNCFLMTKKCPGNGLNLK